MSLINWKEEFSVGVVAVDHEHQELIELINNLHRSVQEGVSRRQVIEGLRDIMDEVEDDGEFDERRLSIDLDRWFSDHFRTHDAKLHNHPGHH